MSLDNEGALTLGARVSVSYYNTVFAALPPDEESVIRDDNSTDKDDNSDDYFHVATSSNSS